MTGQPSAPVAHVAAGTRVTFPTGATDGRSRVLASGRWGLITEQTPFHPYNLRFPDQPSDTGWIEEGGRTMSVVDCAVGAVRHGSGRLVTGADIPVPHGAGGWHWVVVHLLDADPGDLDGCEVALRVHRGRRRDLAAAHTARHLSGLALNAALASLWSAGMPSDSLGHPDFDRLALSSSAVTAAGFHNTYRIKTGSGDIRRLDSLTTLVGLAVTNRVRRWLARRPPVRLVAAGPYLTDRRSWECDLPAGTARVTCDGIHAAELGVIADTQVTVSVAKAGTELAVTGIVTASSPGIRPRTRPSRGAHHRHTGLRAIRH